jgi:hypothetical protein
MNRVLNKIHCIDNGYGRLLCPLPGGRWLAWFSSGGVRRTSRYGFHNCSKTFKY